MSTHLQPVTDSSFDTDVLQSTTPALVDFWAEWCGPCKMIAPLLEEAAVTYAGKIKMVKLNVDENNATAAKFGIRGIPTLLIFKNGKVAATKVGHLTKSQLSEFLDSHVS
jgi:thioredoxin 1